MMMMMTTSSFGRRAARRAREGGEEWYVGLSIYHSCPEVGISGGIRSGDCRKGNWLVYHTSPPGFSSSWPRPGMGRVNVQGIFWASVKIASME